MKNEPIEFLPVTQFRRETLDQLLTRAFYHGVALGSAVACIGGMLAIFFLKR
ncbi:MAG TPA: hypothetical protein VG347_00820 [Verrucomicrobiae bacterium]|nr:hypothetical protein [Verrucomicrobiae bacterium]